MTKDSALGWLRTLMIIVGSFLAGHVILQTPITTGPVLDGIIAGVLFVTSTVWGIVDKTASEEMVTSALAKVITFVTGILATYGFIKAENAEAFAGLVPLITIEIMKRVNNKKDQRIASGSLGVADLKGATNVEQKGDTVKPVISTPGK